MAHDKDEKLELDGSPEDEAVPHDEDAVPEGEPTPEELTARAARSAQELLDAWYEQVSRESMVGDRQTIGLFGGRSDDECALTRGSRLARIGEMLQIVRR